MNEPTDPDRLRRRVYALLITVTAGLVLGRVLNAQMVYEPGLHRDPTVSPGARGPTRVWPAARPQPTPAFGSNDISRWATVRSLVDLGTFRIGYRDYYPPPLSYRFRPAAVVGLLGTPDGLGPLCAAASLAPGASDELMYNDNGIVFQDGWRTVDKVLRPEPEGATRHYFSSKPPLLTVLAAAEYWVLQALFGWRITEETWEVVRTTLLTFNWLPLLLYLYVLSRLAERLGRTDWGRLYVVAAACFGTFLTTFAVTFNNHGPATCCALFGLAAALPLLDPLGVRRQPQDAGGGRPGPGVWPLPGADVPRPGKLEPVAVPRPVEPLRFAGAGLLLGLTACLELPATGLVVAVGTLLLLRAPVATLLLFAPAALVPVAAQAVINYVALGQWTPAYAEFGGPWYVYPGSHWVVTPGKRGIDFADEPKWLYALYLTFGHHGLFSLTPVFLPAFLAAVVHLFRRDDSGAWPTVTLAGLRLNVLHGLTAVLTVVVLGFYVYKSNNYVGGALMYRGLTGHCHLYAATGISTAPTPVPERPPEYVYRAP